MRDLKKYPNLIDFDSHPVRAKRLSLVEDGCEREKNSFKRTIHIYNYMDVPNPHWVYIKSKKESVKTFIKFQRRNSNGSK